METRHSGHAVYRTEYHVIWIPKYRRRILNPGVKAYIEEVLPDVIGSMPGCESVKCNVQVDHIHILMIIPPKYAVSQVVGRNEREASQSVEEEVCLVAKGLLERERRVVNRIFYIKRGDRRRNGIEIYNMAGKPGFRASEA